MNNETTPAPAIPAETKKHNKLELPQQFKLLDWCRQNEDKVRTLADTQLAQIAEAELGFKITVPNLTSVRQGAGIEKLKPAAPPTLEERLALVEQALTNLVIWASGGEITLGPSPYTLTDIQLTSPLFKPAALETAPKIATGIRHLSSDSPPLSQSFLEATVNVPQEPQQP